MNTTKNNLYDEDSVTHFDLEYWIRILYNRRKVFLIVLCGVFILALFSLLISPKKYLSKTSIYFPVTTTEMLPSTLGMSSTFEKQDSANTQSIQGILGSLNQNSKPSLQDYSIAILESRRLRDMVIDKYGEKLFPGRAKSTPRVKLRKALEQIIVIQKTTTKIISIEVETPDPALSADVANYCTEAYQVIAEDAILTSAKMKRIHLEKEKKVIRERLRNAEQKSAQFKKTNKVVELSEESKKAIENLAEIKLFVALIDSEAQKAEEKLESLRSKMQKQFKKGGDFPSAVLIESNPVISNLISQITVTELSLLKAKRSKTDKNPDVIKLKDDIKSLKDQLTKEYVKYAKDIDENLDPQLLKAEVEYRSLKSQKDALSDQLAEAEKSIMRYPDLQLSYNDLEREVMINEALLKLVCEEYERAKVEEERDGTDAQVLDAAVASDAPNSPNIPYSLFLSLIFSLMCAVCVVLYLEFTHRLIKKIKCFEETEENRRLIKQKIDSDDTRDIQEE